MWAEQERFVDRHIGPTPESCSEMLQRVGAPSLDALVDETIPASIRLDRPLLLPPAESEASFLDRLRSVAARNRVFRSYIGLGYYETLTPNVILRNVLENPSWYTPYTPYQAEIAQGRLEALLNFQTMVTDLTGMEIANASLLDEATAAAEAMAMMYRVHHRARHGRSGNRFLVSPGCFSQTIDVLKSRAEPLGIEVVVAPVDTAEFDDRLFGLFVQTPDARGAVHDFRHLVARAHQSSLLVGVATDLLSLALFTPPGDWGADVVVGSAQRFGVPMGYGGPHAAFFSTREAFVREMPGRIIGVSKDEDGRSAYRMALQTREQHIRREKAKSNICTAQALLANIAGLYAVYHGPEGIRAIAHRLHQLAALVHRGATDAGLVQENAVFFDTVFIRHPDPDSVRLRAEAAGVNFRYEAQGVGISLGEPTTLQDVQDILAIVTDRPATLDIGTPPRAQIPAGLARTTPFLTHSVFRDHHSETEMMRYLRRLASRDIGLDTSMIPLGSCTMKLNAATEMIPVTWREFSAMHPFAPLDQAEGYTQIREELEQALAEITGFPAVSLQPNSGAQGEYAGLLVIRAYHRDRGESHRNIVLIPSSAHGTNPASAVMAGMQVVVVACDDCGNVDILDLEQKAERHRAELAALMVTYPSTHGVFEDRVQDICRLIHDRGGLVYLDGANLNAQVGLTSPAKIGADVCHLNLHKTFSIPHGGGGPGMGPIAVSARLAPFLPGHPFLSSPDRRSQPALAAAPWGSASILLISYAYIRLLGANGVTDATRYAILNANYLKSRLEGHYPVLFTGQNGRVAHEVIFDLRDFKHSAGITETDVAKRLMDYGFHAPTVSWPVPGTMMVEPTESESKAELDRFCDALIAIREEIAAIERGQAEVGNNVLTHAPHTAEVVCADAWDRPYTREQAAFPVAWVRERKVWPPIGRIDNTGGDRNLICSCPATESYTDVAEPVVVEA
jgi:glycine dehydrogenase